MRPDQAGQAEQADRAHDSVTVGVDVGGTKIAAGVVDASGTMLEEARRDTPAGGAPEIAEAIAEVIGMLRRTYDIAGVGVGAAGFVNADRSTVLFAPNLPWRNEDLSTALQKRTGLPTVVENDANAAAWAEFRFGTGSDVDDMILLTVGTGLGGGLVVNDRLVRGAFGVAGEVGHFRVVPGGHLCGCGNKGCWEQYASGSALEREARSLARTRAPQAARLLELADGDPEEVAGLMVTQAAAEGDAAASELLDELGTWLGEGIASLAAVLDPALVVVGGGVSEAGDRLLSPVKLAFERSLTARGHRPFLRIGLATLGNEAGIIGAADLVRQR